MLQKESPEEYETLRKIVQEQPEEIRTIISRVERYALKDLTERMAAEFSNDDISIAELEYDIDVISQALEDYETVILEEEDKPELHQMNSGLMIK